MYDDEKIQFMVDPFTGKIAMIIPAPLVVFESFEEFSGFISMMKEALTAFRTKSSDTIKRLDVIEKDYASKVIDNWQAELKNLPTDDGPKK